MIPVRLRTYLIVVPVYVRLPLTRRQTVRQLGAPRSHRRLAAGSKSLPQHRGRRRGFRIADRPTAADEDEAGDDDRDAVGEDDGRRLHLDADDVRGRRCQKQHGLQQILYVNLYVMLVT